MTKSKAAELAGISLWEFLDLAASIEPGLSYGVDEAVAEVRRLVAEVAPAYGRELTRGR